MEEMKETGSPAGTASEPAGRILFADDDEPMRSSLGKCLMRMGFECDFASSGDQVIELLRSKEYDVLLSDINMPGNAGLELLESIPAVTEGLPVILLTGEPTVATASRSVRLRVMAYLTKPPDLEELCGLLRVAVEECRDTRLLKDSRRRIQDWDREIERLQVLLRQAPAADRQATMQSYVRLTLRNLVVGLIELEHLMIHDGERLGTDVAVEKQALLNSLRKTIGVLQKTKDHFKSKELGELRKELENLLG
jgi:DNA-binding response OmpR family regulator